MLKKKGDGKVIRNCRKVAVVEHLRPRILYSADVLAGLLPDLQTDPDDSAQSHPLPWGMARTVSSTENLPGFNSEVEAAGALSIVVGNRAPASEDVAGAINSDTDNIIGDDTGLMLEPLADNGGDVKTHLLLPASVAIDGGAAATTGETDGRGFLVADTTRDIGAFEANAIPPGGVPNTAPGILHRHPW